MKSEWRDGNSYRIFCFFDGGKLVNFLHGIQKKDRKLKRSDIKKAKRLRQQYYDGEK